MSTSAAEHLPPAYPARAPWGTAGRLRAWQQAALDDYLSRAPKDYLAVATPGAGKTTFALRVAAELLAARVVHQLTIVTPTEHLKRQWADAADRVGITVDPAFSGKKARTSRDYTGVAVTYAGVASHPMLHRARCENRRTLVVLDEVHHAGDSLSWGDAVREAFDPATRRLSLTGTPFRTDINPIPFVTYVPDDDGLQHSAADYTYGYADALRDGVVRPVLFMAYSGEMRWRTRAGDEVAAQLGEPLTKDQTAQAWRTALDPEGDWIPAVLRSADTRLTEVRRHVPDAGGLVIATDQEHARAYGRLLARISGERPTIVLSDEPRASKKIAEFAKNHDRWMVAVRMVSEGVDIPRLAVGVYATATQTPLFFAQAVGRFVRARKRGETASIFLPTVPSLLSFANEMETSREHVLGKTTSPDDDPGAAEEELIAAAQREESGPEEAASFEALGSDASFDRVLYDGGEFGTQAQAGSAEEADYLGIPGLLEPHQVSALLRRRQAEQQAERARDKASGTGDADRGDPAESTQGGGHEETKRSVPEHERIAMLRRELNGLVGAWHHRTGKPHGVIHTELRKTCGGPPAAQATADEIQERIDTIRAWASTHR
ncbi:DEAD/DEAH box helicase [Actinobacteria bacterium YIM 96077]|uniref:ATP-dependent helicase n=1 Tax=Phytoactinopolyspora halophila TaxID=1981511 RepID=A0A329R1U3_9ACTN|nr:DEAD/DEAH box helicase [Phytoactinopolyspora halophila]AYY12131.1 DEAD/DEAH box helicase [Actinobacteria bacterium YIM 96077]RAW18634.1 ATP-dependent helicase [Phytoactinopolyspora halophila]